MGYGYDMSGRLCCDHCDRAGGVRKRKCPYTVTDERGRALPYCPPPALCADCYAKLGGLHGVHGEQCRAGAARNQARYNEIRRRLATGDAQVFSAWGEWHESVPAGLTGVIFEDKGGTVYPRLVPAEQYRTSGHRWLSEYPGAQFWPNSPDVSGKRVS